MLDRHRWERDHLPNLLTRWGADPARVDFIKASRHWIYRILWQGQLVVLRLTPDSLRNAPQIQAELDWVSHLADAGLPVCRPVPSLNGRWIETAPEDRHAVVFEWAHGELVTATSPNTWPKDLIHDWGRLTARLHHEALTWRAPGPTREPSRPQYLPLLARKLPPSHQHLRPHFETLTQALESADNLGEVGLIHGDITQANLVWNGKHLVLFDFDSCSHAWFLSDIAMTLYMAQLYLFKADRTQRANFARRFLTQYLKGYASVRRLDPEVLQQLPLLLHLQNAFVYLSLFERSQGPESDLLTTYVERLLTHTDFDLDPNILQLERLWLDAVGSTP